MAIGKQQGDVIGGGGGLGLGSLGGGSREPAFGSISTGMPMSMQPSAPAEFPWDKFTKAFQQSGPVGGSGGELGSFGAAPNANAHSAPNWYDFLQQ